MKGPYIPKSNTKARAKVEMQLQSALLSNKTHLVDKFSKILQGLEEQITNRENAYFNRDEVLC